LKSKLRGEGYERIVEEQVKREVTGEMRDALFGAESEHDCEVSRVARSSF
jgi:hypothetical protein